jgi:uncharacterized protein (TIGR00156 family)
LKESVFLCHLQGKTNENHPHFFAGVLLASAAFAQSGTLKDDAKVTLQGTIQSHIGAENYGFKDASGTIEVEIDDRRWAGQTVLATDRVEIFGEVDKDWSSLKIDVKRIRKL